MSAQVLGTGLAQGSLDPEDRKQNGEAGSFAARADQLGRKYRANFDAPLIGDPDQLAVPAVRNIDISVTKQLTDVRARVSGESFSALAEWEGTVIEVGKD